MKAIHAILAITFAALIVSTFSFADEDIHIESKVKIKIDGAEMVAIDAEDLEIGETHESFTDSGKRVLLTRTEEGLDLEVDGKKIDIGMSGADGHGHGSHSIFVSGDDDAKVIINTLSGHSGVGHGYAFIHGDHDCEDDDCDHGQHHWVQHGDEDVDIVIERISAAEHLEASGALDDLDDETRQRILDTLNERRSVDIKKKVIMIESSHAEIHEDVDN